MPIPLIFARRHVAYRIACGVLSLATILAIFGVISPGWYHVESGTHSPHYTHLWIQCMNRLSDCHGVSSFEGFEVAAQVFSCIALVVMIVACFLAVFLNFMTQNTAHNRWLDITTLAGGGLLFLAAVIFVGGGTHKPLEQPEEDSNVSFGYALAMTFTAAILVLAAGVLIFVFNRPLEAASEMTSLAAAQRNGTTQFAGNCADDDDSSGGFERNGRPNRARSTPSDGSYSSPPPNYDSPLSVTADAASDYANMQPQYGGYFNYGMDLDDDYASPTGDGDLGEPTPALHHAPVRFVNTSGPGGGVYFSNISRLPDPRRPDAQHASRVPPGPPSRPPPSRPANGRPREVSQPLAPPYQNSSALPSDRRRIQSASAADEQSTSNGLTTSPRDHHPARAPYWGPNRSASVGDDRFTSPNVASQDLYLESQRQGRSRAPQYHNMASDRNDGRSEFLSGLHSSRSDEGRSPGNATSASAAGDDSYRPGDYLSYHEGEQFDRSDYSNLAEDSVHGVPPPPYSYSATEV